jgi:hypothetical protein
VRFRLDRQAIMDFLRSLSINYWQIQAHETTVTFASPGGWRIVNCLGEFKKCELQVIQPTAGIA